MWKQIDGYRWQYRINDDGQVQKFYNGKWVDLNPYICGGRARAMVRMRTAENKAVEVPVVWLMADAFMGGRKKGFAIIHKDGAKLNNALNNLEFMSRKTVGKLADNGRRKPVFKIDREGNVVDIFPSAFEASKREYLSHNAVSRRCMNKVKNPYKLTGFTYQYEEDYERKPRKKKAKVKDDGDK